MTAVAIVAFVEIVAIVAIVVVAVVIVVVDAPLCEQPYNNKIYPYTMPYDE